MLELDSVRVKLAQGDVHLRNLRSQINEFRRTKPYSVISGFDSETGYQFWKMDSDPIAPGPFPLLGDTLYNFRSALDHLAHQLVLKNGGTPTTSTEFPIFLDQSAFLTRSQQKMHGMNDPMKALIKSHQPAFGTNSNEKRTLWALQQYGNIDKHRKLVLVAASLSGMLWSPPGGDDNVFVHVGSVQKDTVLARFPPGYEKTSIQIMPGIAFGEPPRLNEDIEIVLLSIRTWITRIVDEFEAAFF